MSINGFQMKILMKDAKITIILVLALLLPALDAFAAQMSSSNYQQNVVVSSGGDNVSSSSYNMGVAIGIINAIISSSSYINKLGFFHTWLLANGQPCSLASQCEGGFCCSGLCRSSACPVETPSAAGAAGGGEGGGGSGIDELLALQRQQQIKDFSINPVSIKEELTLGAIKTQKIRIKNTGNTAINFNLNIATINDFVSLSENSFSLDAGREKDIEATAIGKKLGSYLGEIEVVGDGIKKSISIVIEVESEQALFDVKIDIPTDYKEVKAGSDLKAQVTLLSVGPSRKVDVIATYLIKDRRGNAIYESTETFAVERQKSYVKPFKVPKDALPDEHLAIVEVRYENSFAVSSELFKVIAEDKGLGGRKFKSNADLLYIMAMSLVLTSLFVYLLMLKLNKTK